MGDLKALGRARAKYEGLETFVAPDGLSLVELTSDEVSALCPVTGQPDWYTVRIRYQPGGLCVESKTVKLYLGELRSTGMFVEALAVHIATDFAAALGVEVEVSIRQKARGGVAIEATAKKGGR